MTYDLSAMPLDDLQDMLDKSNMSPGMREAVSEEIKRKTLVLWPDFDCE